MKRGRGWGRVMGSEGLRMTWGRVKMRDRRRGPSWRDISPRMTKVRSGRDCARGMREA